MFFLMPLEFKQARLIVSEALPTSETAPRDAPPLGATRLGSGSGTLTWPVSGAGLNPALPTARRLWVLAISR